jgi:uncharacterized protein YeaO (DUF488 family)
MAAKLTTFRIGEPKERGQGLRLGVTRRPPRGVPKHRWQRDGYFDVWFPVLAPSAELLRRYRGRDWNDRRVRRRFLDAYERELRQPLSRQTVELLAALARRTPIAIGCYCADESMCHRSVLHRVLIEASSHEP